LPIDDTSFRIYVTGRVKNSGDIGRIRSRNPRGSRYPVRLILLFPDLPIVFVRFLTWRGSV
jgi:hypothetical protein